MIRALRDDGYTLVLKVKVLIVTQYFWPENFRINDLVLGLKEKGHEVKVLTGMPNYPGGFLFDGYSLFKPFREIYKGIPVFRVPLIPRGRGPGSERETVFRIPYPSRGRRGPLSRRARRSCRP